MQSLYKDRACTARCFWISERCVGAGSGAVQESLQQAWCFVSFPFCPKTSKIEYQDYHKAISFIVLYVLCILLKWGGCSSLIKSSILLYAMFSHILTSFMLHIWSILRLTASEMDKRSLVFWLCTLKLLLGLFNLWCDGQGDDYCDGFLCPDNWGSGCQGGCSSTGNGRGMVFHFLFPYPLVVPLNLWWIMLHLLLVSSWV